MLKQIENITYYIGITDRDIVFTVKYKNFIVYIFLEIYIRGKD